MSSVSIQELEIAIEEYLERAEKGESFTITRNGRVIAQISPAVNNRPIDRRPSGLCKGRFVVPNDFDAPLPNEVLKEFET